MDDTLLENWEQSIELFFGQATQPDCRVYARLARSEDGAGISLGGTISGPFCPYAQTLPATYKLVDRGPGGSLLAEAMISEPCFWTAALPYLYTCQLELLRGQEVLGRTERILGIRRLGVHQKNLIFDGKRWVLRGIYRDAAAKAKLVDWHEAPGAMVVEHPDERLCAEASEVGVLLVARVAGSAEEAQHELRRLARWPAVGLCIVDAEVPQDVPLGQSAPNVLLAQRITNGRFATPAAWAQVAIVELPTGDDLAQASRQCPLPLVVARRAGPQSSVAEGRLQCDRLQRDLAPIGDFAGYIV